MRRPGQPIGLGKGARHKQIGRLARAQPACFAHRTRSRLHPPAPPHPAPSGRFAADPSAGATVPVGLFGFAMAISRVRGDNVSADIVDRKLKILARGNADDLRARRHHINAVHGIRRHNDQRLRRPAPDKFRTAGESLRPRHWSAAVPAARLPESRPPSLPPARARDSWPSCSAVNCRNRSSTRGEQPTVFSLKSRRSPSRPASGG